MHNILEVFFKVSSNAPMGVINDLNWNSKASGSKIFVNPANSIYSDYLVYAEFM